ncbi:MAG: hypothetical protein OEO83_17315 [Alphaproteobacteria bacterium]|nr:hypothetical protein [Alphaproteobacteria bacterium]
MSIRISRLNRARTTAAIQAGRAIGSGIGEVSGGEFHTGKGKK